MIAPPYASGSLRDIVEWNFSEELSDYSTSASQIDTD